jgi:uncharacterized protein
LIYLDTSFLVPLLIADAHTLRAGALLARLEASVIISDLADLEVGAVLSRNMRAGRLTQAEAEQALVDFDAMRANSERLGHGPEDFLFAGRLIRDFATKLAAADALHLASARHAGASLATFDERLAAAARLQNVDVLEFS